MISKEDAIRIAKENGLEEEVTSLIDEGCTPIEALEEWDLVDYDTDMV